MVDAPMTTVPDGSVVRDAMNATSVNVMGRASPTSLEDTSA
jgi:hypothetical protein